ncbi:alpha/beta fold hydrolase [Marinitoga aeolica]|uniref:Alpha/beta fold hydrolase n=1 Tax=Marinitoga aeolica TaxID=2809031 RepID=A0ABY8PTU4_9BACT|nr:alpha/beta fold hydrolase [Marinitoga aeolica]WGS65933.1 alpha/beta fold hydrolase [Marinitoga aeolica]
MKKLAIFLVLILSIVGFSKYQNTAIIYLKYLYSHQFDKAIDMSIEIMKKQLPESKLKQTWETIEKAYGNFQGIEKIDFTKNGEYEVYIITSKFEKTKLSIIISVDKNGKIAGLFFNQAKNYTYNIPSYADTSKFKEIDITLGEKWKLNGKLTVPNGKGPFSAVILIHGSGPNDMDETIGPNKPFRDLAYGLSTNGIVVLRYDKRTKIYGNKMKNITLNDEVFEDVNYAIDYLKKLNYVDKIYILGHSLGGYLAPYIAKNNDNISGIILMAAPARALEDLSIEQLQYLKKFEDAENIKVYDILIEQLKKIKNNELDDNVNVLGAPVYYYKELREYMPTKYLPDLNLPILILQGKRDYQVTEKDYDILKKYTKKEQSKLYDDLNHLFIKGEGDPNPYEYYSEGHVDKKVIKDIVDWIKDN